MLGSVDTTVGQLRSVSDSQAGYRVAGGDRHESRVHVNTVLCEPTQTSGQGGLPVGSDLG